jgi:hypothetical protein
MMLPTLLIFLAERLAAPMWIAYLVSTAWYIYEIVSALTIRPGAGPLLLFSRERMAGDLFALAGTIYWLLFGVSRHASRPAMIGSLTLAGLHVLLFAVRAYLVPMLWVIQQTSR